MNPKSKPKYHILPVAPVTVSIIIIGVRPTNISMITVAIMLISSTVIIMVRYMDIIGLSFSIQQSLIIDCKRSRLNRDAWLLRLSKLPTATELSNMT